MSSKPDTGSEISGPQRQEEQEQQIEQSSPTEANDRSIHDEVPKVKKRHEQIVVTNQEGIAHIVITAHGRFL